MNKYFALLRAVNVGGSSVISMEKLREFCERLGLRKTRTLLNSGNIVFESSATSTGPLETLLAAEALTRLSLNTDFFVRSPREVEDILRNNPLPHEARRVPGHLIVMFLKEKPKARSVRVLRESIPGREVIHARGRHLYIYYPDGVGRSKLTLKMIEGALSTRGTGRNWNTVVKLAELLKS